MLAAGLTTFMTIPTKQQEGLVVKAVKAQLILEVVAQHGS